MPRNSATVAHANLPLSDWTVLRACCSNARARFRAALLVLLSAISASPLLAIACSDIFGSLPRADFRVLARDLAPRRLPASPTRKVNSRLTVLSSTGVRIEKFRGTHSLWRAHAVHWPMFLVNRDIETAL